MYATFCEHNWLSTALFDNSRWSRTNSIPSTPRPSSHNHWKCSRTSGLSQENKPIAYNTVVSCKNLNVIMGELSINSISFLTKMLNKIIVRRHESIVLQKLSIMLLSRDPKNWSPSYNAFKKMPTIPNIMPLILANNISL